MPQVVIENPSSIRHMLNPRGISTLPTKASPARLKGRRVSSYFIPIPRAKKKKNPKQMAFETEWTQDRIKENEFINKVRGRVALWRKGGYHGITSTTPLAGILAAARPRPAAVLLPDRGAGNRHLYHRSGQKVWRPGLTMSCAKSTRRPIPCSTASPSRWRRQRQDRRHGDADRLATLNKLADPQDARFSDAFLIVTPGITIRDRLRVLLPNDPQNYYREMTLCRPKCCDELGKAKIHHHQLSRLMLRERIAAGKLTKSMLTQGETSPVHRNARPDGAPRLPRVGQQEEHYRHQRRGASLLPPQARRRRREQLTGDERKEAEKREEEARVWISGLEAVKAKIGVKAGL